MSSKAQNGELWVVATPLGNPGDLSPRAQAALGAADCILAEDTRRAGLLLARYAVTPKRFLSLHEHNERERLPAVLEELRAGKNFALISDAGTPLLSDPGYRLVRACRQAGLSVRPIPGPAAPLAALCASGLPPQPFAFLGFPPRKAGERRAFFLPYASLAATLVFFERKDRLRDTLALAAEILGPRDGCLARELTKTYEEFIFFRLEKAAALPEEILGEVTVLLGPPEEQACLSAKELSFLIRQELAAAPALKGRELARRVKAKAPGWKTDEIYALLQQGG